MSRTRLSVKKGDQVEIIAGKDKGKRGQITRVYTTDSRVLVEGLNQVKRHVKPTQGNPQGGMVVKESPIHVSNVMLVDPKTDKPTRIGRKKVQGKNGKDVWARFAKRSGELLDTVN